MAEVLRDVLEVLGVQGEGLGDLARRERGGGEREVFVERLGEAPGDELFSAELAWGKEARACGVVVA